jgi:hypothetical protein
MSDLLPGPPVSLTRPWLVHAAAQEIRALAQPSQLMPERILGLASEISTLVSTRVDDIQRITTTSRILALNASIEAARAGAAGAAFSVVAGEVKAVSNRITTIVDELQEKLDPRIKELNSLGGALIARLRGARLADLALNMIDIIDRNLYERSCDVRWWATDSAVVNCLAERGEAGAAFCTKRLGVILDAYTVYLDLWVADADGCVVANGRPAQYGDAVGRSVAEAGWFRQAMASGDGTEFSVADIATNSVLGGRSVATYAAAIREGGETQGRVLGVLGIFFDWQAQSESVVKGVRLTEEERSCTRCMILDREFTVIASSDGRGVLEETYALRTAAKDVGSYSPDAGTVVGFSLTPGYETYQGLGWYGVVEQRLAGHSSSSPAGSGQVGLGTKIISGKRAADLAVTRVAESLPA